MLGVFNFDLMFQFALIALEGTTHDERVLRRDALMKGFKTKPGEYYLGDAGYPLKHYCLTPYHGVHYHHL